MLSALDRVMGSEFSLIDLLNRDCELVLLIAAKRSAGFAGVNTYLKRIETTKLGISVTLKFRH